MVGANPNPNPNQVRVPWWEPGFGGGDDGFSRALDAREQAEAYLPHISPVSPPYLPYGWQARRRTIPRGSRRTLPRGVRPLISTRDPA